MAKARKAKSGRPGRAAAKRRTKQPKRRTKQKPSRKTPARARSKVQRKPAARRARARKPQGVVDTVTSALSTVAETFQESQEMARKAGPRGGLSEG
jgi:hypothetical protein